MTWDLIHVRTQLKATIQRLWPIIRQMTTKSRTRVKLLRYRKGIKHKVRRKFCGIYKLVGLLRSQVLSKCRHVIFHQSCHALSFLFLFNFSIYIYIYILVTKHRGLMVVLYPDFSPSVLGGQPSLMMLTNKSLLATGAEFGLVRRNERSLPIEPSPCWHFFFSKYSITQIYFNFFFSSPCSFIYIIFYFFGKRFIYMIDT